MHAIPQVMGSVHGLGCVTMVTVRASFAHELALFSRLSRLFVDANDLPVGLAAELDFAGPSVETLNADRR
jgi:hypothetical protein